MPRYWRDPDTRDVIKTVLNAPTDSLDVVVVLRRDWARLVELLDDEPLDSSDKWQEVDAIIEKVGADNG